MTSIYFNTKTEIAKIRGSERAELMFLCHGLFKSILREQLYGDDHKLRQLALACEKNSNYSYLSEEISSYFQGVTPHSILKCRFETFFDVHWDDITVNGKDFNLFCTALNTAYLLGSDSVKLAARIHGSCELHGFVLGKNKKWLAGIIVKALERGVYKKNVGWDSLIVFLLKDEVEPVVMSYSVINCFPNPEISNYAYEKDKYGDPDYSQWEALGRETQWDIAFDALLKSSDYLELSPETWDDFYFVLPDNAFSFCEALGATST